MPLVSFPNQIDVPRGSVVAVGNFDGVHAGHRALLAAAGAEAGRRGLPLVVLTFEPHPRAVLFPDRPLKRLMELPDKVEALVGAGADAVAVLPFDVQVAGWRPERFVRDVLCDWLGARVVAVGENFRYGQRASGTVATLVDYGAGEGGFSVLAVPLVCDAGGVISSSRLRDAVVAG